MSMLMMMWSCHRVGIVHRRPRIRIHVIRWRLQWIAGHLRWMMIHDSWWRFNDILLTLITKLRLLLLNRWLIDWRVFPLLLILAKKKNYTNAEKKSLTL